MVNCSECGYLALRRRGERELVEADEVYRSHAQDRDVVYYAFPVCFVRQVNLQNEIEQIDPATTITLEKFVAVWPAPILWSTHNESPTGLAIASCTDRFCRNCSGVRFPRELWGRV